MIFEVQQDDVHRRVNGLEIIAETFQDERVLSKFAEAIESGGEIEIRRADGTRSALIATRPRKGPFVAEAVPCDEHRCSFEQVQNGWQCSCGEFYAYGQEPWSDGGDSGKA